MSADDEYKPRVDDASERPGAADTQDDDYKSRSGQQGYGIPVVSDSKEVDSGLKGDQNTDEQLGEFDGSSCILCLTLVARDDKEAIDTSNILDEKTRGARPEGGYKEPGDEEGLEME